MNQWLENRPAFCRVKDLLLLSHTTRRWGRRRLSWRMKNKYNHLYLCWHLITQVINLVETHHSRLSYGRFYDIRLATRWRLLTNRIWFLSNHWRWLAGLQVEHSCATDVFWSNCSCRTNRGKILSSIFCCQKETTVVWLGEKKDLDKKCQDNPQTRSVCVNRTKGNCTISPPQSVIRGTSQPVRWAFD